MNTMSELQLEEINGGGDSLQKDIGQFIGGSVGWIQANLATYLALGPVFGGLAASSAGLRNASL